MLQRTRADQVSPVFRELRLRYSSWKKFSAAPEGELRELFAPLGLGWRIDGLVGFAGEVGLRSGRFRMDDRWGRALRCRSTSFYLKRRAVIVDSNVVRILARLVDREFDGETRRKTWLLELAESLTPSDSAHFNYAVLDFAALVCTPRSPDCESCPIVQSCAYGQRTLPQ
jgi:A/G-specific adenine glycosylase